MFFGLTNSPVTFQTMIDDIFQEEVAQGWLRIYIDYMIIATEDDEILHELRINHILDKLEKYDLFLKPEKCKFHQWEVEYLGVIIGNGTENGPDQNPRNHGMANTQDGQRHTKLPRLLQLLLCVHKRFLQHRCPLNNLTCKNQPWNWSEECNIAFNWLKEMCGQYPILCTPDWSKQFIIDTDVSGYALGVVIAQEFEDSIHPVAFHSWSLLPAEANYDAHDKELAGVIFGFKCGRPLFLGASYPICVCTDHKNLQYFHDPHRITGWQAR